VQECAETGERWLLFRAGMCRNRRKVTADGFYESVMTVYLFCT
jgi:hypothetical protein